MSKCKPTLDHTKLDRIEVVAKSPVQPRTDEAAKPVDTGK